MSQKKVVLAYSGGLDTSVIVSWLNEEGYDVIAILLDLGQKVEDFKILESKGYQAGAKKVFIQNVRREFVTDYVYPALMFNAVYEGTYLLGTSLARPLIAKKQIEFARSEDAQFVSHGATGKGNDQVRFEMTYHILQPGIQIVAPWKNQVFRDRFPGRKEMIEYANEKGIPVKATMDAPWSSDENLMHISFEAGMLEDPWVKPRKDMFELSVDPQDAPDKVTEVNIEFIDGLPVQLDGQELPPEILLDTLNDIAGKNGVGRIDIVESRFVGMKSRGVYETPGYTVLLHAHRAIESITLSRDVIDLKETLMPRFSKNAYNGFWFTPEMELMMDMARKSQKNVTGSVRLELYKGNVIVTGRKSPFSLYDADIASMEKDKNRYRPEDADGFIKLNALPFEIFSSISRK